MRSVLFYIKSKTIHLCLLLILMSGVILTGFVPSAKATGTQYTPIDLGVLGGTVSNNYSFSIGMNDAGEVIGESMTNDGSLHAFVWTLSHGMIDLGNLGGVFNYAAYPIAINKAGQIVGWSYTSDGQQHAFLWTESGGMVDLGTLPGGASSNPTSISSTGMVVGNSETGIGKDETHAGETHAFSWTQAGGMVDLGTLGGNPSLASAVNDSGQVVGSSPLLDGNITHAFSWTQAGGMVDLGTLGGSLGTIGGSDATQARAINSGGQVVGNSITPANTTHAFLWTQTAGITDLSTLDGNGSNAYSFTTSINDSGQIIGQSGANGHAEKAFLWTQTTGMIDLGNLGWSGSGHVASEAFAMNSYGQVVGGSFTSDNKEHAFSWTQAGGMVDLGTLGGLYSGAISINNYGQIAGSAYTSNNIQHATLWQPVPPSVNLLNWSNNPLQQGQNTTLSASVTDNSGGIASVQYSIDGGTPQAMTYDSVSGTWKTTFGSSLAANTYNITVTATNQAGNTSSGTNDILAVYTTTNGYVAGHAKTLPIVTDTMPITKDTTNNPTKLVVGFTNVTAQTSGSFDIDYSIKNNVNEFKVSNTSISWVVVQNSTHASVLGHGNLTTYVNGVQSTTNNVTVRFDITLGIGVGPDHVSIKIFNPGLNPNTDPPTYIINDDVISNGSNLMIHP